ncbi:hypothetical protein [Sphaerisporangium aureirubrum]|uniref:Fibronectin attachment protein n=1 Tax=Sphaerisporangium aureirubrum TaxID=1544736 RepID=A0ABW1N9B4_9ACTN
MADAETAPLPRITIEEPPPAPAPEAERSWSFRPSRLGDLPMRVIYRIMLGLGAAVAVTAAAVIFMVTRPDDPAPTASAPTQPPAPGAALPATPMPSATQAASGSPAASSSAQSSAEAPTDVSAVPAASTVPSSSPLASSAPPSPAPAASGSPAAAGAAPTSTPGGLSGPAAATAQTSTAATAPSASPVATPGRTALELAEADPRVPAMPGNRKLANFPGRGGDTKGRVTDKRSGITFARFVKEWKLTASSPFATRRTLPAVKGAGHRGVLATCPVPILVQKDLKDTAYLAARWTLNHHPAGAKITWLASQPFKAGKRDGWLLGYRVTYLVDGDKHRSTAAVALVDVPKDKPALVFITIPDAQKKRFADINTLVSSIRPL